MLTLRNTFDFMQHAMKYSNVVCFVAERWCSITFDRKCRDVGGHLEGKLMCQCGIIEMYTNFKQPQQQQQC